MLGVNGFSAAGLSWTPYQIGAPSCSCVLHHEISFEARQLYFPFWNNNSTVLVERCRLFPSAIKSRKRLPSLPTAPDFRTNWTLTVFESTRGTTSNTVVFSQQQDVGYNGCRAPVSDALPRSASIIFICAFSDNVDEIVRTLHNGLTRTNRRERGI